SGGAGAGGESGGDPNTGSTGDPVRTPDGTSTGDPPAAPRDGASVDIGSLNAFARAAVDGINAIRGTARACDAAAPAVVSPAVGPISWNTRLEASAFGHAKDMQARDVVDHLGSDGSTVGQRATAQGYVWQVVGENLGAGFDSFDALLRYWSTSPAHCRVLMDADFVEIGLAKIDGTSANTYSTFWALDMARVQER
ncbi:MAG: CAP domain-containing protein, partial [Burkholderiaceae bacterium]